MKTSRAQVESNREALLAAASEGFRKHGFDGLRVADLMKQVGLTHGGFYGYFDSKEDLIAAALELSLKKQAERMDRVSRSDDADTARHELSAFYDRYLSKTNRDTPESACLFPSLATDISRQSEILRTQFTEGLKAYLAGLGRLGRAADHEATSPMADMALLVGAMVLARAVNDADFSDSILEEARAALKKQHHLDGGSSRD